MEENESMGILSNIHACMKRGEEMSSRYALKTIGVFAIFFSLFICLPFVLGLDYFADPTTMLARCVFSFQIVVVSFGAAYIWVLSYLRKNEIHTFKMMAAEIDVKISQLVHTNEKKTN